MKFIDTGVRVRYSHHNGTVGIITAHAYADVWYVEAPGFGVQAWHETEMVFTDEPVSDARGGADTGTSWFVQYEDMDRLETMEIQPKDLHYVLDNAKCICFRCKP